MTSDLHHFAAFGREQLLFDWVRNTGSVAPRSSNQKQDPFTQVKKQARLNKEKQLERPSDESGLISEGDVLIGKKNKLTVQRCVQFELQDHNGSNSMFGGALEIIVAELPPLVEQKQPRDTQIKELKEALDHAKAEIREEKEAEQKISALMEDCISLLSEKLQQEAQIKDLKEALDHAKAEIREEKEARVTAEQIVSALTEERSLLNETPVLRVSLVNEKLGWEDEAKRWEKEKLDWMAKTAQLTELPRLGEQKQQQEAQIKELKEALDHAKAEIREEKEARCAAQLIRDLREERISYLLNEKLRKQKVHWTAKIKGWLGTSLTQDLRRFNTA